MALLHTRASSTVGRLYMVHTDDASTAFTFAPVARADLLNRMLNVCASSRIEAPQAHARTP